MKRENPTIEICPGITRRTVAHGKNMYQMMATLAAGSKMPAHTHPQEQIVHILEGQMRLIVDGVPHELSTGDSFYLASNVPHGVETLLPTRVLDTFSPPRSDYLAIDEKVRCLSGASPPQRPWREPARRRRRARLSSQRRARPFA